LSSTGVAWEVKHGGGFFLTCPGVRGGWRPCALLCFTSWPSTHRAGGWSVAVALWSPRAFSSLSAPELAALSTAGGGGLRRLSLHNTIGAQCYAQPVSAWISDIALMTLGMGQKQLAELELSGGWRPRFTAATLCELAVSCLALDRLRLPHAVAAEHEPALAALALMGRVTDDEASAAGAFSPGVPHDLAALRESVAFALTGPGLRSLSLVSLFISTSDHPPC
jgi:hypothetical protein